MTAMHVATRCIRAAVEAADPGRAVERAWSPDLRACSRVHVLAFGKAAPAMAGAASKLLGTRCRGGLVLAPSALVPGVPEVFEAWACDHPDATPRNALAAERVEAWADALPAGEPVLVLISGGGSAYLTRPRQGVRLEDLSRVARELNSRGASIRELNAVRVQAEVLKGGGLSATLGDRRVEAMAVSDVIGDDPRVIASGPLSPGLGSIQEARAVLRRYGIDAGTVLNGEPNERVGGGRSVRVVASNAQARDAAARTVGAEVSAAHRAGEARVIAESIAGEWSAAAGRAVAWGGEATVRATGGGRGGPVQEMMLTIALALDGEPFTAIGLATDGVDGPTDAAGALVDGGTAGRMRAAGVDPARALESHNSYEALDRVGALVRIGPTGTNVNDLVVIWGADALGVGRSV